jgi:hypothetical protein
MSGLSLPVDRPTGRALLVAGAGNSARPLENLKNLGFSCTLFDDPYAAMTELCRRPLVYRALILSLASLYREELTIIPAVKSRFPHVELWLTHTDGRQAALAEAMRLGADGLLSDDGLHRVAGASPSVAPAPTETVEESGEIHSETEESTESGSAEPILTNDELRALLHEQSSVAPEED